MSVISLNLLVDFIYATVRETWYITAIITKYLISGTAIHMAYKETLSLERFSNKLLQIGKPFLLSMTGLGLLSVLLNLKFRPVLSFSSQLVALGYTAYLFWKY